MKYKVMLKCDHFCENYEPLREISQHDDADEAIRASKTARDQLHYSWVELVK